MQSLQKHNRRHWRGGRDLAVAFVSTLAVGTPAAAGGLAATNAPLSGHELQGRTALGVESGIGYRPVVGQTRYYKLTSTGDAGLNMKALAARVSPDRGAAAGQMDHHRFEVSARLGTRVLEQQGDEWLVAMRLSDARYVVDGNSDSRAKLLETPFLVRVTRRGELRSFEFPVKFPQEAQVAIRALVEPMQVVFTDTSSTTWNVGERTSSGSATVDYRVTAVDPAKGTATLTRTLTAARRALPGTTGTADRGQFNTRIEASNGQIQWSLDGSGPQSMQITEKTTSYSGRQALATSDTTFTATLVSDVVAGLPSNLTDAKAGLRDPSVARASFYRVPPSLEDQVSGVDWDTAYNYYMQKIDTATSEVVLLMQMYLRKYPEHARTFANELNELSKGERTEKLENAVGYGFAAIGAAGHTEAQQVLVDVITQPSWTELAKEKALDGLLSVEMPERFVPKAVWSVRAKLPTSGAAVNLERLSITTNVYGQMGNHTLGVPENTSEVVKNLGDMLNSADPFEQARALVAFGNIGDPELALPHTDRFFRSSHEQLRSRAFDSFRNAESESAFVRFASYYQQETSVWVRREASAIAVSMADSPARNVWAADAVRNETDQAIRVRAVTILGRALENYPENEVVLRGLLDTVKDREVRRMIYTFVSPKARGAK